MGDLEYDRFGPWVIEITDDDPPSPLFLLHLTRPETPLLNIKIPRNIEHRNAHAGMNLYDYLVSLYNDDLVILQRIGDGVREHTFRYRDIQYLRYSEELLKGTVHLGLGDQTFTLPFNTVSSSTMEKLVALIRERYCAMPPQAPLLEEPAQPIDGLSFYFNGLLLKRELYEPQYCLLAAQADKPVASSEPVSLVEAFFTIVGKSLLESLHWSDGRELKIITRGQDYKYKWQAVYAKEYTYLPLEKIRSFRWQHHPRHTAVCRLDIETAAGPLSFVFTEDNPFIAGYTQFLAAVSSSFKQEEAFTLQQLN